MELIETLYRHILFFSNNGDEIIEHPGLLHEVCKSTGRPRDEVQTIFFKMVEIGFIEKVQNMQVAHRVKTNMSIDEIKTILEVN